MSAMCSFEHNLFPLIFTLNYFDKFCLSKLYPRAGNCVDDACKYTLFLKFFSESSRRLTIIAVQ